MKTRIQILGIVTGIFIFFLISCEKENTYEFGDMQTEFEQDSVYFATTDGFLTVQYLSPSLGDGVFIKIYSDNTENPSTIIGELEFPGISTLPIKKNNYWKVVKGPNGSVIIGFTPLLNIK